MQLYIFPYIGYFKLISVVNKFIFYDDGSYIIKECWINRNRLLMDTKAQLFTIQVLKESSDSLFL